MKGSAAKIQMTGFDDLFGAPAPIAEGEHIQEVSRVWILARCSYMQECWKFQAGRPRTRIDSPTKTDIYSSFIRSRK